MRAAQSGRIKRGVARGARNISVHRRLQIEAVRQTAIRSMRSKNRPNQQRRIFYARRRAGTSSEASCGAHQARRRAGRIRQGASSQICNPSCLADSYPLDALEKSKQISHQIAGGGGGHSFEGQFSMRRWGEKPGWCRKTLASRG